jgi:uncharacterized protein YjbJ (UPF0337 family)
MRRAPHRMLDRRSHALVKCRTCISGCIFRQAKGRPGPPAAATCDRMQTAANVPLPSYTRFGRAGENMHWDEIEGKWNRVTGSARERWGKLTDNDWETVAGRKDQLVRRIQERYGV